MKWTILYKFSAKIFVILAVWGCTDATPASPCPQGGKFIMHLINEPGEIRWDTKARKYYIWFSPESKLNFDTKAIPCTLDADYQKEMNIRFEGDFFEGEDAWVVNLRHIEKV